MSVLRMRVEHFGRWLFWVSSRSRKSLRHLVDLEPTTYPVFQDERGTKWSDLMMPAVCSCEGFLYHGQRPCAHILAACVFAMEQAGLPDKLVERVCELLEEECDLRVALTRYFSETYEDKTPKRKYRLK